MAIECRSLRPSKRYGLDGNRMALFFCFGFRLLLSSHCCLFFPFPSPLVDGGYGSTPAVAQMLATMLYGKRFFPYYTNNIIGGIDAEGKGAVYSFDPVGSYEREAYRAGGSASSLLQPLIDNQVGFKNQGGLQGVKTALSKEETVGLVKDLFTSAAERDIYTGDCVEIQIITKDGVEIERFDLRKD